MPMVDRNNPVRGSGSSSQYSLTEFLQRFPDDAACLDFLWRERFAADGSHACCPKCDRERKFHRVKARPSYSCDTCGKHVHPLADTIFHKSATSLKLWFYAVYIATSTSCGVSARQLERELGVTYKTAWRMLNLIRKQLVAGEDDEPLSGETEIDEVVERSRTSGYRATSTSSAGDTTTAAMRGDVRAATALTRRRRLVRAW
jgi:transposase-like protein